MTKKKMTIDQFCNEQCNELVDYYRGLNELQGYQWIMSDE